MTRVLVMSPSDLGALVREARERRGWTQTDLGTRIGASRFWVAAFERGKPGAELGLSLHAVAAVGLRLRADRPQIATRGRVAPPDRTRERGREGAGVDVRVGDELATDLDEIVGAEPRASLGTDGRRVAVSPQHELGVRNVDG